MVGDVNEEKEEALARGQTLVSYIEWEDFEHSSGASAHVQEPFQQHLR